MCKPNVPNPDDPAPRCRNSGQDNKFNDEDQVNAYILHGAIVGGPNKQVSADPNGLNLQLAAAVCQR